MKNIIATSTLAAAAFFSCQPADAAIVGFVKASFSGGVYPGSANVVAPFTGAVTQGQAIGGLFIYNPAQLPAANSGYQNVYTTYPAGFAASDLFSITLGSITLTAANEAPGEMFGVQYVDGTFNGFAGQLNFNYQNAAYALTLSGRSFTVNAIVDGFPDPSRQFVGGYLNSGLTNLTAVSPSVPTTPAVPEPATWAMMLVGFGMVAATARYRRRSTAVTFG